MNLLFKWPILRDYMHVKIRLSRKIQKYCKKKNTRIHTHSIPLIQSAFRVEHKMFVIIAVSRAPQWAAMAIRFIYLLECSLPIFFGIQFAHHYHPSSRLYSQTKTMNEKKLHHFRMEQQPSDWMKCISRFSDRDKNNRNKTLMSVQLNARVTHSVSSLLLRSVSTSSSSTNMWMCSFVSFWIPVLFCFVFLTQYTHCR